MKWILSISLSILLLNNSFAQQKEKIAVARFEYVWDRQSDNRVVIAKDSLYQDVMKASFARAIGEKWTATPVFDVTVYKLPALRTQPKFTTSVENPDSTKSYIFLQLFDRAIPVNPNNALFSARFDVRYRMIKNGESVEDKSMSFKILRRDPPLGMIAIKRYPFHPSQFKLLCDTIASTILNDKPRYDREIWLNPACAYAEQTSQNSFQTNQFYFDDNRSSVTVVGENGFLLVLDTVKDVQIGKNRHGAGNTAGSLLTFFSNIDTEKKRSTIHVADHVFRDDSVMYHAYIGYVDTRVAERRRVKDEDGFKSNEVGDYRPASKEINPDIKHVITADGDTVSSFNIRFGLREDHFDKMWDGHDPSMVDSLPKAFNNFAGIEMEMKGVIDNIPFILTTNGDGRIKKVKLNDQEVFLFYSHSTPDGLIRYGNMTRRQLKILTLIALLSDKYFNYN